MESKRCTSCRKIILLEEFKIKRTGRYTNQCIKCLLILPRNIEIKTNVAIHERQRSKCRDPECGGGGAFCKHGKYRFQC